MTFDPKCVICYDLLKNEYFEYVSNDPFSPKKLLEKKEKIRERSRKMIRFRSA